MNLEKFLRDVLPSQGTFFIATKPGVENSKFRYWEESTLPKLAKAIARQGKNHTNVWFGASSFKNGSSRSAINALARKSIALDIDAGPGKDYATKQDGNIALGNFVRATGLHMPTHIVDSGHGTHPWWAFTEDIEIDRWQVTAKLFQELCERMGFRTDAGITADPARILRAPGTVNYKPGMEAVDASLSYVSDRTIDFLAFTNRINKALEDNRAPAVDNSDLGGGLDEDKDYPAHKYAAKVILAECAVLNDMLTTGGAHVTEKHWMYALILLSFCEDGELFIHDIGNKHPKYTVAGTERKFEIQHAKVANGQVKPILCKTIGKCAPNLCAKCIYNGRIKTPLMCGIVSKAILPVPYFDTPKGTFRKKPDADDESSVVFVCPHRFGDMEILTDGDEKHVLAPFTFGAMTGQLFFPLGMMADLRSFTAATARDMTLQQNERKEVHALMTSWTQQMQEAGKSSDFVSSFGWVHANGQRGFSTGESVFWADGGTTPVRLLDRNLCAVYTPKGDDTVWRELADIFNSQSNPAADMVLAASFAAPLMPVVGDSGGVLSIVSAASGTGKTTLLRLAQAVWGDPRVGLNSLDDTAASIMNKMGMLKNLPALWDEVRTPKDADAFVKMIFRIGQGKDKQRLSRASTLMQTNSWDTLMISASNTAIRDHMDAGVMDTDAGTMRIFEVQQPVLPGRDENVPRLVTALSENYGHAGTVYAQWLACNRGTAEKLAAAVRVQLVKRISPTVNERFWMSMAVGCVTAAGITNNLGLTKIDLQQMTRFIVESVAELRGADHAGSSEEVAPTTLTASAIVIAFLNAHARNTLVTASFVHAGPGGSLGDITELPNNGDPTYVHYAKDEHKLRLDAPCLNTWLYDTYRSKRSQQALLKAAGVRQRRCSLGAGGATGRRYVYEIPLDVPEFDGVITKVN